MRLILDASVAVTWCATSQADEMTLVAAAWVLEHGALVPAHFPIELASVLLSLKRRKRLEQERIDDFLSEYLAFDIEVESLPQIANLVQLPKLAERLGLTIYDCAYLDAAMRHGLPLATRDRALAAAAKASGVELFSGA